MPTKKAATTKTSKTGVSSGDEATAKIDALIASLTDWRGETLAEIRTLIHRAVPDVLEEWKWMGSPVWSHAGIIAVGNAHKAKVKVTFQHGAHLDDPDHVFNNGLDGNAWRSIDLADGEHVDAEAFVALVRRAAAYNAARPAKPTRRR